MPPQPAKRDGALDPGAEVVAAASYRKKRRIDALDINPTVLHGLNVVRDLDDLTRGGVRIGEGTFGHELFHAAIRSSLSSLRMTILSASSGSGRCSALASSQGARIQTSCSSAVVRITGIAFGWIAEERPILVHREPHHVLLPGLRVRLWRVFSEAVGRDEASVLGFEPYTPMRRRRIADIGDRRAAHARRWRHAPAHRNHLAPALSVTDNWRWVVREYAGHRRQVAYVP